MFNKTLAIEQLLESFPGANRKMMLALQTDALVLHQLEVVNHLSAARTFLPETLGEFALFPGAEGWFRKNAHGPWKNHARATTSARTDAAPAARRTRAHSSAVEPVVKTSSTSKRWRWCTRSGCRTRKAP